MPAADFVGGWLSGHDTASLAWHGLSDGSEVERTHRIQPARPLRTGISPGRALGSQPSPPSNRPYARRQFSFRVLLAGRNGTHTKNQAGQPDLRAASDG